jgi:hypothetical protein
LIKNDCEAHAHSVEYSWRLADILACTQKVSHPVQLKVTFERWGKLSNKGLSALFPHFCVSVGREMGNVYLTVLTVGK